MATIVAATGGGNWSATGTWVGGVVPGAGDDVTITVACTATVTIDGTSGSPSLCRSLNCTGFTHTLAQASGKVLNIGDGSGGALTIVSGMTYSPNSGSTINFVSTTGVNTVKSGGKTLGIVNFNGAGGSWVLGDNWTTAGLMTLTAGQLDFGAGLTHTQTGGFNSSNSNTRTLIQNTAIINCASNWTCSTSTNLTVTIGSGASSIVMNQTGGATFDGGGETWFLVKCTGNNITIASSNSFTNFTTTIAGASGVIFTSGTTQTISGTLTLTGSTVSFTSLNSSTAGSSAAIICNGTVTAIGAFFQDIAASGSASWNLSAISGGSADGGGNSGITFTTGQTLYWSADSGNYNSNTQWFTATNGGGSLVARQPLPQDTCRFDANSFSTTGKTITNNRSDIAAIDFTGALHSPTWTLQTAPLIYGNLTLISGMTLGSGTITFSNRTSQTFTTNALSLANSIKVDSIGGTVTFADAVTNTSGLTLTSGNATSSSTMSLSTCTVTSGTLTLGGNMTLTGALSVTGTIAGSGYNITGATTITIANGGSVTLSTLSATSAAGINGTLNVTTLTLSGAFTVASATANVIIGSGGMTCTTFGIQTTAGSVFTSGSGLINCSSTATLTAGTITIGSGGITATTYTVGTASHVCTINAGSGTLTATGTGTVWNAGSTNLTYNAQTSTISITDTSSTAKTFTGNTLTYNNISVSGAASDGTVTFSGAFTANTLTFAGNSSILWTASTTFTFSSLVCNGTAGNLVTFASTTNGTAYTQSCANAVSVDYLSVRDSTASGHTPFYAGAHGTLVSGNTNWLLVPATGSTLDPIWFGMTF